MITEEQREEIIRKQARIEFLNRLLLIFVAAVIVGFMATTLVSIKIGIDQRQAILSCTTPSGACYKAGEARTAKAVQSITLQNKSNAAKTRQIVIYAAYCATLPGNKDNKAIESCTRQLLKSEGDHFITPGDR